MTQEDKELLLKDLCARLLYNVKISVQSWDEREMEYMDRVDVLYSINGDEYIKTTNEDYDFSLEDIKPYLFPLSSITKEQESYLHFNTKFTLDVCNDLVVKIDEDDNYFYTDIFDYVSLIDWLNKIKTISITEVLLKRDSLLMQQD